MRQTRRVLAVFIVSFFCALAVVLGIAIAANAVQGGDFGPAYLVAFVYAVIAAANMYAKTRKTPSK